MAQRRRRGGGWGTPRGAGAAKARGRERTAVSLDGSETPVTRRPYRWIVSRRHEVPGATGARPSHACRAAHATLYVYGGEERRGVRRRAGAEPVIVAGGRCRYGRGPSGHGDDAHPEIGRGHV